MAQRTAARACDDLVSAHAEATLETMQDRDGTVTLLVLEKIWLLFGMALMQRHPRVAEQLLGTADAMDRDVVNSMIAAFRVSAPELWH